MRASEPIGALGKFRAFGTLTAAARSNARPRKHHLAQAEPQRLNEHATAWESTPTDVPANQTAAIRCDVASFSRRDPCLVGEKKRRAGLVGVQLFPTAFRDAAPSAEPRWVTVAIAPERRARWCAVGIQSSKNRPTCSSTVPLLFVIQHWRDPTLVDPPQSPAGREGYDYSERDYINVS